MKKIILISVILKALSFTATAQYAVPLREGQACTMITQKQLKNYLAKLKNLLNIAQQDKDKYGTTGAYPATAIHFHMYTSIAYDSLKATVEWLSTGNDNNPEVTSPVEAMSIKSRIGETITRLIDIRHWAELSAIYHNSSYASCGKEEALRLMAEAMNILAYAGRCYTGPYEKDIPPPSCK
jgi:hypothetical protein